LVLGWLGCYIKIIGLTPLFGFIRFDGCPFLITKIIGLTPLFGFIRFDGCPFLITKIIGLTPLVVLDWLGCYTKIIGLTPLLWFCSVWWMSVFIYEDYRADGLVVYLQIFI
jgi:hypothetical protein